MVDVPRLTKLSLVIAFLFSLSSCSNMQDLVNKIIPGAIDTGAEIPVGDFVGLWQYQDEKLEEAAQAEKAAKLAAAQQAAANGATANGTAADTKKAEEKKPEEKKKPEDKKAGAKKEETKTEEPAPAAPPKPKPDKSRYVKIVLLPLDPADDIGIGMLTFRNITQRFYWEAKGNGKDTWNIQFAKDNNIYTRLTYGFDFTGTLRKSNTGFELTGSLHVSNEGKEEDFVLETYRHLYPELTVLAADKSEFTTDVEIQLSGKHFADEASDNVLKFVEQKSKKEFKVPAGSVRIDDAEKNVLTIMPDKKWPKGDYQLSLTRNGEFKSNTISIKLK